MSSTIGGAGGLGSGGVWLGAGGAASRQSGPANFISGGPSWFAQLNTGPISVGVSGQNKIQGLSIPIPLPKAALGLNLGIGVFGGVGMQYTGTVSIGPVNIINAVKGLRNQ